MSKNYTTLEQSVSELTEEIREIRDLLDGGHYSSPLVSLEDAAVRIFKKKPSTVLRWIKQGLLRAVAIPDGGRGHHYYFMLDQLKEDLESNFTI